MTTAEGLLPEEYHAVIAPAMKAAAELAAARGDPYLYNDFACMLALAVLVGDLSDLYQDQWGALGQCSPAAAFKDAPIAACVMVLSEYDIDHATIGSMIQALATALDKLKTEGLFGPERAWVQQGWDAANAREDDRAAVFFSEAAKTVTAAIDLWEAKSTPATGDKP